MGRGLTERPRGGVDRASPTDVTNLAVDRGPCPMNIAAVLYVEDGAALDLATLRGLLEQRLPLVRRMRQCLVTPPPGCGRPFWADDATFDLGRHLTGYELRPPEAGLGADGALLRAVADLVCTPLPRDRPLWRARWITGLGDGRAALVLVVHHVMADGIGGLAVLAALADGTSPSGPTVFPQPWPTRALLAADAFRGRWRALKASSALLRRAGLGVRELGLGLGSGRPQLAPATSLNRPTGPRRRLTRVTVPLAPVVDLGHSCGCTVNDVVLTAIVGALAGTLRRRGEDPDRIVVSVPISSRRGATVEQLGNETGVVPMTLPTTTDPDARLAAVAAVSRERRAGPPGASAGPMGLVFRGLGRLGLFQAFIDRQRLVNTFVTNVRGPSEPLRFGGHLVSALVPVAVNPGNVGVSFDVMSYAGRLGITLVADPDVVPDQDVLTDLLEGELAHLLGHVPDGRSRIDGES